MNISMNPNGELYQSAVNAPGAIDIPESFLMRHVSSGS